MSGMLKNRPGPFAQLHTLKHGDQFEIQAFGQTYVYEVRSSERILAKEIDKMLRHEEKDWVTLVTCEV